MIETTSEHYSIKMEMQNRLVVIKENTAGVKTELDCFYTSEVKGDYETICQTNAEKQEGSRMFREEKPLKKNINQAKIEKPKNVSQGIQIQGFNLQVNTTALEGVENLEGSFQESTDTTQQIVDQQIENPGNPQGKSLKPQINNARKPGAYFVIRQVDQAQIKATQIVLDGRYFGRYRRRERKISMPRLKKVRSECEEAKTYFAIRQADLTHVETEQIVFEVKQKHLAGEELQ